MSELMSEPQDSPIDGVAIINLQDRAHPVEIARISEIGVPRDITIADDLLFVITRDPGSLWVLDVTNPAFPVELANFPIDTYSRAIGVQGHLDVEDGVVYLTAGSEGLLLLKATREIRGSVRQPNRLAATGVTITINSSITTTTASDGSFIVADLDPGSYTVTPSYPGYTFLPLQRQVNVPPNAGANFTLLPLPVSTGLSPGITTTLTYTDTQGLPTSLVFPAGSVGLDTQLILTPTIASDTAGSAFAAHAFELGATQQGAVVPELSFSAPVSMTIQYSADDTALITDLADLALWWWDGEKWQDAAASCQAPGSSNIDSAAQVFKTSICRTGLFSLYGPTHPIFLPELITP